ncbi:MAG TPA: hemolysin, partial [Micavibrio sp.]
MANQDNAATANSSENSPATSVTLSMTTADIKHMDLSGSGSLIISKADGSVVTLENFQALAQQGAKLTLQDGETIDAAKLFETLAADLPSAPTNVNAAAAVVTTATPMVSISAPEAGHQAEITLRAGEKYIFAFDPTAQDTRLENGDLIITFENGGVIVIHGYEQIAQLENPPSMQLAGGQVIDPVNVLNLAHMADRETGDDQADLRKAEHADDVAALAQKLAAVQPAAGGDGAGSAAARGGFGFGSVVDPAPLEAINPIGPLGPTALQFSASKFVETPSLEETQPPGSPTLETQSVQVYEDGSVLLSIVVSSNGATGVNTVGTISG